MFGNTMRVSAMHLIWKSIFRYAIKLPLKYFTTSHIYHHLSLLQAVGEGLGWTFLLHSGLMSAIFLEWGLFGVAHFNLIMIIYLSFRKITTVSCMQLSILTRFLNIVDYLRNFILKKLNISICEVLYIKKCSILIKLTLLCNAFYFFP